MLKLLTDEHISRGLIRGLLLREPELDVARMQDVGLRTKDDPTILAWAANELRVLLTLDGSTIPDFAYERIAEGLPMAGVIVLQSSMSIGRAIEHLLIVVGASLPDELEGHVLHLPL